ncbi:PREDICTED: uncharacterized protein LOC109125406 [Camelina sativa]|uniref:Uncharacterized protein LOC109125406 n=1 Tax=Camelina sativa TaxID=90675 RepID=A0ABM1Q728_CAMSA|nr:PREDICTED: uncharacterized protein LOC109125406 [Camelina sativa]
MTTVRATLKVAAARHWSLHQMDVHNAFLHGDLNEEIYMKLPPGFRPENGDRNLDLGALKYFLGTEVARREDGIFLNQRKYALDILKETGLLGSTPETFPMEQQHGLGRVTSPLLEEPARYRPLRPTQAHWEVALHVVCYLNGSPGQGILLSSDDDLKLTGWCDADWAGCPVNRRSLIGWLVSLGTSPLS